jgi:carboxypeptidase Q
MNPTGNKSPGPNDEAGALLRDDRRGALELSESLAREVGPRLAGSDGDRAAVAWAERTMKRLGLEGVHTEPVTAPVWKRGTERAEIATASGVQRLAITALGWSGATPAEGIEAEILRVETLDELSKLPPGAAKDKIVFFDFRMPRTSDGAGYGKAASIRYNGPKNAAGIGAAAVVVRSAGTDEREPHTGVTARMDRPIPAVALSNASADLLEAHLASAASAGKPAKMRLVSTPTVAEDATSANVVGEVRAPVPEAEIVLLGAHLDSWDIGRGAVDDAAGCGIVLQAARLLATRAERRPLRRTVRVVLFAAEENSGAGSKAYAEAHRDEIARHVLAIEADEGTARALSIRWVKKPPGSALLSPAMNAITELGIALSDEPGHAGADVSPLLAKGVPVLDVRQDATGYFDLHHTAEDLPHKLDGDALAQVTTAYATLAWAAATIAGDLGRVDTR